MTEEQITQWAREAGINPFYALSESIQTFATIIRNETLDLAKEVCRQVVRSTLTWEGCKEIQEALEKEKA